MKNLRKAAEIICEAWFRQGGINYVDFKPYMETLRRALAQPEQEPVAWMFEGIKVDGTKHGPHLVWKPEYMDAMSANMGAIAVPLYTAPPTQQEMLKQAYLDGVNSGIKAMQLGGEK